MKSSPPEGGQGGLLSSVVALDVRWEPLALALNAVLDLPQAASLRSGPSDLKTGPRRPNGLDLRASATPEGQLAGHPKRPALFRGSIGKAGYTDQGDGSDQEPDENPDQRVVILLGRDVSTEEGDRDPPGSDELQIRVIEEELHEETLIQIQRREYKRAGQCLYGVSVCDYNARMGADK
jgi:hypothetical protein